MDWETPTWTEIKMDAELSSYVDDLGAARAEGAAVGRTSAE